jgi:hypothetical protein
MGSKARRAAVTLAGLTLVGGAVVGMTTPASAASPAVTSAGTHATAPTHVGSWGGGDHGWGGNHHRWGHRYGRGWQNWGGYNDNDWRYAGLYANQWTCARAGQWLTRWSNDNYTCVQSYNWQNGWNQNAYGSWRSWGSQQGWAYALYVQD